MGDGRFRVLLRNASTEDKENAASLKITLADFDGIAQVWYYIVMVTNGLDGIIIGELSTTGNYGGQLFISDAGIKYRKLSSGTYGAWNKLITNADIQSGSTSVNLAANGTTEFEVTFPKTFSANPNIYVNVVTSRPDLRHGSVVSRTTSGFTGAVSNNSSAGTVVVFWTAITP